MASSKRPREITVRCYNVGFGDCFLVTFHYSGDDKRHVLIDFGSTSRPRAYAKDEDLMVKIAADIKQQCGAKLHAVVATHRHRDHISGFATRKKGDSGDIIRSLLPDVVIQPWTEDPDAETDAEHPVNDPGMAVKNFVGGLRAMHSVAAMAESAGKSPAAPFSMIAKQQLGFLGENNLANKSAIDNLRTMGENKYVYFGSKSGLETILPGVKAYVLGPPTLEQSETIRKQSAGNQDEFWHFAQFWSLNAAAAASTGANGPLFPHAATVDHRPPETRWFIEKAHKIRGDQMLGLVRVLDKAMNNTSVILLFEAGGKRLLFPGDAQLENWLYALQTLEDQGKIDLLEQVDLYKVGHHGSLNATPKSLWKKFQKRGDPGKKDRMRSVMSTKPGKHGHSSSDTEVPRKKLVTALDSETALFSTHTMKKTDGLCHEITIDLRKAKGASA